MPEVGNYSSYSFLAVNMTSKACTRRFWLRTNDRIGTKVSEGEKEQFVIFSSVNHVRKGKFLTYLT